LNRSEINLINIGAYNKLAPVYKKRTITTGRYPVLTSILLDDGDKRQFFVIDSCQYNFEMAFIDFYTKQNGNQSLKMLDIGFGAGNTLNYFAGSDYETTGVDFSKKMCETAKKVSPKSEIHCADIFNVDFKDECFDVITMMSMLCQLPTRDARALLTQVRQWLKPNGYIYASTSVENNSESGVFVKETIGCYNLGKSTIKRFRTNYTIDRFIKLLESSGFGIVMPFITYEKNKKSKRQFQGYICKLR